jgi:hypothetical protein
LPLLPFEWSFFGQNLLQLKVVKDACRNSTNEISYGTIASAQLALMAVDRCRDGHRSGELLQPLSFALHRTP